MQQTQCFERGERRSILAAHGATLEVLRLCKHNTTGDLVKPAQREKGLASGSQVVVVTAPCLELALVAAELAAQPQPAVGDVQAHGHLLADSLHPVRRQQLVEQHAARRSARAR